MTRISHPLRQRLAVALLLLPLAGCEWLGIDDPAKLAAAKEAEGKAVGSACRHAQRAIEDCYTLNPKAQKAAVFSGWKEMDEYMRENKLEVVAPTVPPAASKSKRADDEADSADQADSTAKSDKAEKTSDKASEPPADKAASKPARHAKAKPAAHGE